MERWQTILETGKQAPHNLDFADLCYLVERAGWVFARQNGSHMIYKHPKVKDILGTTMNIQNKNGKAKPAQIRQVIEMIEKHDLLPGGGV